MASIWERLSRLEIQLSELKKQLEEEPPASQGHWEEHPCVIPNSGIGISHVRLVWSCWCGRRWRLDEIKYLRHEEIHKWTEVMSGAPISDEEIMYLLEGGNDAAA